MTNNKYKLLVVEDEENIRTLLSALLEANGYQVLAAGTGAMGKLLITSHRPDLVLLDLGLPDMDGLELLRTLRAEETLTPVIVLSARTDEREKVTALDLGANDYVTKPFGSA
ncbi:MAG: response regulator, partial [Oscillospiraceae bacterium]|nr:response regulator [Oscillospiraceae bacterium]